MRWKQNASSRKTAWMLVGAGAAMIATKLTERGLESGWRKVRHEDPPEDLWKRGRRWPVALGWAALSAAAIAASQLAARRGANAGLQRLTGKRPPAAA
jgi:hypothetical protein